MDFCIHLILLVMRLNVVGSQKERRLNKKFLADNLTIALQDLSNALRICKV